MLLSWCEWHVQVYAILWKSWHDKIWGISHRGGNEMGATATTTEMVPRQHSGPGNSIEVPVEKNTCDGSVSCEEWWGAPGYRVPTCRRHGNEEEQLRFTGEYNNQTCISYNTCICSTAVVLGGYTFEACVFGAVRVVEGSSCSRDGSRTWRFCYTVRSRACPVDVQGQREELVESRV